MSSSFRNGTLTIGGMDVPYEDAEWTSTAYSLPSAKPPIVLSFGRDFHTIRVEVPLLGRAFAQIFRALDADERRERLSLYPLHGRKRHKVRGLK